MAPVRNCTPWRRRADADAAEGLSFTSSSGNFYPSLIATSTLGDSSSSPLAYASLATSDASSSPESASFTTNNTLPAEPTMNSLNFSPVPGTVLVYEDEPSTTPLPYQAPYTSDPSLAATDGMRPSDGGPAPLPIDQNAPKPLLSVVTGSAAGPSPTMPITRNDDPAAPAAALFWPLQLAQAFVPEPILSATSTASPTSPVSPSSPTSPTQAFGPAPESADSVPESPSDSAPPLNTNSSSTPAEEVVLPARWSSMRHASGSQYGQGRGEGAAQAPVPNIGAQVDQAANEDGTDGSTDAPSPSSPTDPAPISDASSPVDAVALVLPASGSNNDKLADTDADSNISSGFDPAVLDDVQLVPTPTMVPLAVTIPYTTTVPTTVSTGGSARTTVTTVTSDAVVTKTFRLVDPTAFPAGVTPTIITLTMPTVRPTVITSGSSTITTLATFQETKTVALQADDMQQNFDVNGNGSEMETLTTVPVTLLQTHTFVSGSSTFVSVATVTSTEVVPTLVLRPSASGAPASRNHIKAHSAILAGTACAGSLLVLLVLFFLLRRHRARCTASASEDDTRPSSLTDTEIDGWRPARPAGGAPLTRVGTSRFRVARAPSQVMGADVFTDKHASWESDSDASVWSAESAESGRVSVYHASNAPAAPPTAPPPPPYPRMSRMVFPAPRPMSVATRASSVSASTSTSVSTRSGSGTGAHRPRRSVSSVARGAHARSMSAAAPEMAMIAALPVPVSFAVPAVPSAGVDARPVPVAPVRRPPGSRRTRSLFDTSPRPTGSRRSLSMSTSPPAIAPAPIMPMTSVSARSTPLSIAIPTPTSMPMSMPTITPPPAELAQPPLPPSLLSRTRPVSAVPADSRPYPQLPAPPAAHAHASRTSLMPTPAPVSIFVTAATPAESECVLAHVSEALADPDLDDEPPSPRTSVCVSACSMVSADAASVAEAQLASWELKKVSGPVVEPDPFRDPGVGSVGAHTGWAPLRVRPRKPVRYDYDYERERGVDPFSDPLDNRAGVFHAAGAM